MLDIFMGRCCASAAFYDVGSLNDVISEESVAEYDLDPELGDAVADPAVDIELDAITKDAHERVRAFVVRLSPLLRCVVLRHFWLGHSQAEIATDLGVTRSAVCHAIARCCRQGHRELAGLAA